MIDRLTVLRAERVAAAEVLEDLRTRRGDDGARGFRDHMDALSRNIAHLDRAIAAWDGEMAGAWAAQQPS